METLLTALAVIGAADRGTLASLTGIAVSDPLFAELRRKPTISIHNGVLTLEPIFAAAQREALSNRDFLHFRRLHEDALDLLAERMRGGEAHAEAQLLDVFDHLAERLINQDPEHLLRQLEAMCDLPFSANSVPLCLLYEGIALRRLGQLALATDIFNKLLVQPNLNRRIYGRAVNALAICQSMLGHLQAALDGYAASLAIWRELGDRLQEGLVLLNIGIAAYELNEFDEAARNLLAAEVCFVETDARTWLASAHHELGLVYRQRGEWQTARDYLQRCLQQRQHEGANEHIGVTLNNLGEVWLLQGDLAEAQRAFEESLTRTTNPYFRIDSLVNMSLLYEIRQELEPARRVCQGALALAQSINRGEMLPTLHYRLGHIESASQDWAQAQVHWQTGIDLIETSRAPLRDEGIKISLLGRWQQLYDALILLFLAQDQFADALSYVERARTRALLDMLADVDSEDAVPTETPLTAAEIQARLPPETALIEYFATGLPGANQALLANLPPGASHLRDYLLPPEQLWVFVVTRDTIHAVQLDADIAQIQAQHFNRSDGRLRGMTPLPGQQLRPMRRWQQLADALLLPLQPYLTSVRHLYFVPHAALHYLPLHVLTVLDQLTGATQTTASYAPSASILFKTQAAQLSSAHSGSALAIGVNSGGLAHAEAEASWIAQTLHGQALLGPAATVAVVCDSLAGQQVLHFSGHGYFRPRRPMESALQLADGELSAATLLRSAKLTAAVVTLSACDTGLHQLRPSDEPLGLIRAFLGCGASALVVTLWPVHEIPTRLLMEQFYTAWRQGHSKANALLSAQRYVATITSEALLDRLRHLGLDASTAEETSQLFATMVPGPQPFNHPYYWGAFLLIGDPG